MSTHYLKTLVEVATDPRYLPEQHSESWPTQDPEFLLLELEETSAKDGRQVFALWQELCRNTSK